MDLDGPQVLTSIFTAEELVQVPTPIQAKLKSYLDGFYDDYCKQKADANRLHVYEQKTEDLESKIQDYESKLESYAQNVMELRDQLDQVSAERTQLLEAANSYERNLAAIRDERNLISDERDSLLKVIERQKTEIDRLHQDVRSCQQQLKTAINQKCEALARIDEVESKEAALGFKERRMEQEHAMLTNQIKTLTEDLNRNLTELQNSRRTNAIRDMDLQARLTERIEELKIVKTQNCQYKETIEDLHQKINDLSSKYLSQAEEANKMKDHFKKELEAKTKLAELYCGNAEDAVKDRNELAHVVATLKRVVSDASDQYGELETKLKATELKHAEELSEKDKYIESLRLEITHANDLMKELQNESLDTAIAKLAPSAAVASRLIRADMSLTELYSLYVKTSEELEHQKRENSRANLHLNTILHELGENAPVIKKQELEYGKLVETNHLLSQEREELIAKKADLEETIERAHTKCSHLERENKKLKNTQIDLSRQVCYLLKEVEQLRIGIPPSGDSSQLGNPLTTEEVISKKLVTFSTIADMQENNQKLLLLVRDLSTKLEEAELERQESNEAAYKEKVESYAKKFAVLQETLNQQNRTVATLLAKCDRYKKMYFDLQKSLGKTSNQDLTDDDSMHENDENDTNDVSKKSTNRTTDRRVHELEQQLEDLQDQYKRLKEQHEYYAQEKRNNEKILNEQFDSMRTEVRELTSTNCKLLSALEYHKEQIKLQQKNTATYKQQIAALEDRSKNYESTIIKHEQTLHILRDDNFKLQRSNASFEAEVNHLRHENRMVKDMAARLQSEKEVIHREQQNQNLLLQNLELIKSNLERSESEGRARVEQRLDETVRELSAQRRRFQEEEDRFRDTINELKHQTDIAKQRMEEEKAQADKLRGELITMREDLAERANQIDSLSKKLQESLMPTKDDNPIAVATKKVRELENKLQEALIENKSLSNELSKAREHSDQYYKLSQSAETEIQNLHATHTSLIAKAEEELKQLRQNENNLKSRIQELEADLQLTAVTSNTSNKQPEEALKKAQDQLAEALQKVSECNRNLRTLRAEHSAMSESLHAVENKYANEMVLHSADINELSKLKAELSRVQDQLNEVNARDDNTAMAYKDLKESYDKAIKMHEEEKNDLEQRVSDLNELNTKLHEQMEALTTKLSILSQTSTMSTSNANDESTMDTSASEWNRSQAEDDAKNSDQLLQIIKFVRREKDLTVAKLDIFKAENTRLLSEHAMLQKKIEDLSGFLNQERTKSEAGIVSATKHEEILRKIESLNALTDSNRALREERNALSIRVKDLTERISVVEDELFPLQKQNRELTSKIEESNSEIASLRTEAIKWRQRANVLVEKSNKNPEEFKRLQMERESLAKMLTTEKEAQRQLTEELNAIKADKARLETDIEALEKQVGTLNEEKKKLNEDLIAAKQSNMRMLQEVMELKNKLLQREESIQKLTDDIEAKEAQLQDIKNKEVQIRKIAKRYKDSYMELCNKNASAVAEGNSGVSQDNVELGTNNSVDKEEQHRSTVEGLNNSIRTLQEENEKLRKDYENVKTKVENDERSKTLLQVATTRIVSLTDSKQKIMQELEATQAKLQTLLASSETHEATIAQYENTVARLEKELTESNVHKESLVRLTREGEDLKKRISQLGRQFGLQQSAKPSTSSVANEKSCISESSPRTANVKPMSGTTTVQQSATVTPWRGSETPLASIRPMSVQNSRKAAVHPTSQQTVQGGSTSTSSSSISTGSCTNTALVPPQQQVHTTGSSSVESMSSSPTSSHTDYMPSTSSPSVAVAAIPPMGSATAAESSQEAESVQHQQPNESQLHVSGGQQQVVALVSPRVEGSSQNVASPNLQQQQDTNNQQPSTSGSSSISHIAVSSHTRHTPSSSNVTTTQSGSSTGHKRARDPEGDSSTSAEDCGSENTTKQSKRMRTPMHGSEQAALAGVTDSGFDVDQEPTSSQRDDVVVVDSEDEDGLAEADDGPTDGEIEHEVYEDSYEQDHDMDENECPESNAQADAETDNNEVDVDEGMENIDNQGNNSGPSTSQAAAVVLPHSLQPDNHQQSQAISSGSYVSNPNVSQTGSNSWKQASSSFSTRQQKTPAIFQQGMSEGGEQESSVAQRSDSSTEIVSSPQGSKYAYNETIAHSDEKESKPSDDGTATEQSAATEEFQAAECGQSKKEEEETSQGDEMHGTSASVEGSEDVDVDFSEDAAIEASENVGSENHPTSGASQSEMQEIQQSQLDVTSEDNEGVDGVSSEGEKQVVEEVEEEGREAEATSSPTINTRSKATSRTPSRKAQRGFHRGGPGRPTPIIWQDGPGTSRNMQGNQTSPVRGFPSSRNQRGRRADRRRPGGNYNPNMRYS